MTYVNSISIATGLREFCGLPEWLWMHIWATAWQNQQVKKNSVVSRSGSECIFEPPHDKTNKMACMPCKDSVRSVWSESSLCTQWVARDPMFLHADSEDSAQTGRMPRLIWGFAGRTCHCVGFVMQWLNKNIQNSHLKWADLFSVSCLSQ